MRFATTCDQMLPHSPCADLKTSDFTPAHHFHKALAKHLGEVEMVLAAEFEQALSLECLELRQENESLRAELNMQNQQTKTLLHVTKPVPSSNVNSFSSFGPMAMPVPNGDSNASNAKPMSLFTGLSAPEPQKLGPPSIEDEDISISVGDSENASNASRGNFWCERENYEKEGLPAPVVSPSACPVGNVRETMRHALAAGALNIVRKGGPSCAFVVNVRRLVAVHQFLSLLHVLIQSTAMAAITLVAAGSTRQFACTICFIICVFILSAMHETDWDRLDVQDMQKMMPLICDDVDPKFHCQNPNRIFKAISISTKPLNRWIRRFCHLLLGFIAVTGWMVMEHHWRAGESGHDMDVRGRKLGKGEFGKYWAEKLIADQEDASILSMQLMVGTLMYTLQSVFAYIGWRETVAVMPRTSANEIWDPRCDGIPMSYWLLGLPAMWFTSQEALRKLKYYIDMAKPGRRLVAIYPQELSYYALSGTEERKQLQTALKCAKLFDSGTESILKDGDGAPEQLDIDLCFFDNNLQHKSFPYPGDFNYFEDDET